ncbi:MAG: RNA 3'-terminal phosphate cyclase, partial [Candidatus Nanohalobium sp.]
QILEDHGFEGEYSVEETGFYPEGGGTAELGTRPYSLEEIDLVDRGELESIELVVKASDSLEDGEVAEKTLEALKDELDVEVDVSTEKRYVETASDGVVSLLKANYENTVVGFDEIDERGKRAEQNAFRLATQFDKFRESEACVDKYMADQLIVFLSLIGGEVAIREITDHVQTNLSVVEKFGKEVEYEKEEGKVVLSR